VADRRTEPRRQLACSKNAPTPTALVQALVHPLRREILRVLHEAGEARSPRELTLALGCALPDVSYHVAVLADINVLILTDAGTAGGSTEHYYASAVGDDGGLLLLLIATQGRDRGR
jgi:DNA-binding transcriptional ArsR family regulator